jgi:hypothetical protein
MAGSLARGALSLGAGLASVFALDVAAQLPVVRLTCLFPPGGKAGSSVEVTVSGSDLDDTTKLWFSNPAVTSTQMLSSAGEPEPGKFMVTIVSNAACAVCDARVVGRFGISNPRAFVVGHCAEALAPSTNSSPASAAELAPETIVNGRLAPGAPAWYRFAAKKGQRLFIECLAASIDSRMDATLILGDSAGRELALDRTSGLIDFTAPADGEYRLRVADFLHRGGDDYFYRLALTAGPHVDFIFPPAGLAGTTNLFTLYGRNLPGGKPSTNFSIAGRPLEQLAVEIAVPASTESRDSAGLQGGDAIAPASGPPASAPIEAFEYCHPAPGGPANPVRLCIATAPVVLEAEPNDKPAQEQKISPPCEVAGQFFPADDADLFRFDAKKGDVLWIEVFSQRLGLPTDPLVVIQRVTKNDKGEEQTSEVSEVYDQDTNIGDREFNTASRDPVTRFEAKEDGAYRITVRDVFGRTHASPRNVYRLAVRKESPDFRLVAMAIAPKFKADAKDIPVGVPLLRRGETLPLRVMAFRRDGFSGDIELSIENPPPGLRFDGDRIDAGKNTDTILLTANEDAPAFAGPIRLAGKATIGGKEVIRIASGGTMLFPVGSTDTERPEARVTRDFTLAICELEFAPVSVAPVERKTWEVTANGKLEIPLRVTRRGDFNAALKLKPLGPGVAEALKEFDVDGKATNATFKLDLAALKLAPGSYVFAVQGPTTGKYRNNPEAAAAADAAAKDAEKLVGDLATAAKKAAEEFDKAAKAATEAEAATKAAAEKLTAAKATCEKTPEDEKAKADRDAAQKSADEAAAKSKSATEAKAAAEKSKTDAGAKSKDAAAKKEQAAKRAKELNEKAKPRDASYMVCSTPIAVKVTPAPPAESKANKETKQAKSQ